MRRISRPTENGDRPPDTTDADVCVLGDGAVGAEVTRRLQEDDRSVTLIDGSSEPVDVPSRRFDHTDLSALDDARLDDASAVIVATSSDSRNLLVAQLVRSRFDVDRLLVVANDPGRVDAFADAGHDPVCATTALADAIVDDA